jgi:nitrate/nitrite transport system ATP-binding protein
MAFLELEGVSKEFGGPAVLRGVDLAIGHGELVAVIGRSGCGKTTLLSIAAGLLAPSSGAVRIAGKPAGGPGPDRAVVFQNYSLLPWLSVHDNVRLAVDRVHPVWSAAERRAKADEYVALVNLAPASSKKPHELSGGMRDEIERIWSRARTTALLVTNDVDEAIRLADRIVPMVPAAGGGATLGAPIEVALPRPRDRRALGHDPRVRALRAEVVARLRGDAPAPVRAAVAEVAA